MAHFSSSEVRDHLDAASRSHLQLQVECDRLEKQRRALKKQLTKSENARTERGVRREAVTAQVRGLAEKQPGSLQKTQVELQRSAGLVERVPQTQSTLIAKRARLIELKNEEAQLDAATEELARKLNFLEAQTAAFIREADYEDEQVDEQVAAKRREAEKAVERAESKVKHMESEIAETTARLQEAEKRTGGLRDEMETFRKAAEESNLKGKLQDLETRLQKIGREKGKADADRIDAESEIRGLKKQIAEGKYNNELMERNMSKLNAERRVTVERLEGSLADWNVKAAEADAELVEAERKLEDGMEGGVERLEEIRLDEGRLAEECGSVAEDLTRLNAETAQTKELIEVDKLTLQKKVVEEGRVDGDIAQLDTELGEVQRELDVLQTESMGLEEELAGRKERLEKVLGEKIELEKTLTEEVMGRGALADTLRALRGDKLCGLQCQLDGLRVVKQQKESEMATQAVAKLKGLRSGNNALRKQIKEVESHLRTETGQCEALRKKRAEQLQQIGDVKSRTVAEHLEWGRIEKELQCLDGDHNAKRRELNDGLEREGQTIADKLQGVRSQTQAAQDEYDEEFLFQLKYEKHVACLEKLAKQKVKTKAEKKGKSGAERKGKGGGLSSIFKKF